MEEATKQLLVTLNDAIKSGLDTLPGSFNMSLEALQIYHGTQTLVAFGMILMWSTAFFVCFKVAGYGVLLCKKTGGDGPEIMVVLFPCIFAVGSTIFLFISCSTFVNNISGWTSPLGKILASSLY